MPRDPNRRLCDARLAAADFDRLRARAIAQGKDPDAAVKARLRHSGFCTRPALPGSDRCQWHGGYSTGPLSPGGMARSLAGRAAWLAARKAASLPMTMGRKPGTKDRPKDVIEAERAERIVRRINRLARIDRRKRERAARQEAAELAPDHVAADIDIVQLAIQAIEKADAHGVHMSRSDIISLEHDFITRLQAGDVPTPLAERIYHLLMQQDARIDRGELEDLNRRARLEAAYERFLARSDARSVPPRRPQSGLGAAENQPASASPAPCPPCVLPVDNFVDNSPVETREDATMRRAYEAAEVARVARPLWAYTTPAKEPAGPVFYHVPRRRP